MEVRFTLRTLTTCHFATSRPRKSYFTSLEALSPRNWNLEWKLEYLGSERPQSKFSEGGAFLVNWAVAPPGWCHTQFLYKFWKLCVRAFKWYIICGTFSNGRFFKWAKQKTVNLGVWHWFSETVSDFTYNNSILKTGFHYIAAEKKDPCSIWKLLENIRFAVLAPLEGMRATKLFKFWCTHYCNPTTTWHGHYELLYFDLQSTETL